MPRLRPGLARVEFFAVREDVMALLTQGHTYASAYDQLKEAGKISMSYSAFRNYVHNRSRSNLEPKHGNKPAKRENDMESTAEAASTRAGEASAIPTSHAASAPAPESTPADQALVPAHSGPIQAKGKTSKFDANDFDINELGPTKEK